MASWIKLSYHRRLFVGLVIYSWLLLACFAVFQYQRERQFKADELNASLQVVNENIINDLKSGDTVPNLSLIIPSRFENLRISVIDDDGKIVYDNTLDSLPGTNHLEREEIKAAKLNGEGYILRRHSESTGNTYFYSAKCVDGYIVRSAVPYSESLDQLLAADYAFLWGMLCVTVVMCVIGFFVTRRVGRHVERLKNFAEKAERGERIFDTEPFPHDELGDISNHIVRLYARLQQALSDLAREHRLALHEEQEKIRIKRRLTNNINHELKTPVAMMQVCLETLTRHKNLSEEKKNEFIARCLTANERLQRLLTDVSAITRMEDGGENIEKSSVVISEIIAGVCGEYDGIAQEKGMEISNRVTFDKPILGNEGFLSSVFRNLIDNALAYSGGTKIDLWQSISPDGASVKIFVADNGNGVEPEHLSRLFERFYRVDKGRSRQAGGTGLGLAIVKNTVLWHGWAISVENRSTGGLLFTITIKLPT